MEPKDIKTGKDYLQYLLDNWDTLEIPVAEKATPTSKIVQSKKTLAELDGEKQALGCLMTVAQVLGLAAQQGYVPTKRSSIIVASQLPAPKQDSKIIKGNF